MPNLNAPRGFVPKRFLTGASWNGQSNMYYIPSTDGSAFAVGDAVKSVALSDANGCMGVQKAAGADTVRGVIVGILPAAPYGQSFAGGPLDLAVQTIPAAKARAYYVLVCDDPNVLFEIMDDGLANLTATAVNKNASFTVANPVAPAVVSGSVLSTASVAVTNTLNVKLMGLSQQDDNAFGQYARWLVKFNLHELLGGTAGV
jgi:hypothetical protein